MVICGSSSPIVSDQSVLVPIRRSGFGLGSVVLLEGAGLGDRDGNYSPWERTAKLEHGPPESFGLDCVMDRHGD